MERPSSVVKELVENAIDAGASAITVEIKEGGISLIRITDNGCGIPKEEVPLAFLRHSTSKIRSAEDLMCVHSLGFRGEALSSIAAVSRVEMITKPADALTGTRYVIEGSKEIADEEIGAPDGTTFLVRDLFSIPLPDANFLRRHRQRAPTSVTCWKNLPCPIRIFLLNISTTTRQDCTLPETGKNGISFTIFTDVRLRRHC